MEPQTKAPQATQACAQPGDEAATNKRTAKNGFTISVKSATEKRAAATTTLKSPLNAGMTEVMQKSRQAGIHGPD